MSVRYVPVQWTRHKRVYDAIVAGGVIIYLALFISVSKARFHGNEAVSDPILLMRALGSCAFVMLSIALCIGPLARLDRRFLPLLYNRRHLGVATFCIATMHGFIALGFYHGFGIWNPFYSLLVSNTNYLSFCAFPFQVLGLIALALLACLAFTSHDFWNRHLGPRCWKAIHMLVYAAYAFAVMHVALGAMQGSRGNGLVLVIGALAATVASFHIIAGAKEQHPRSTADPSNTWIPAGRVEDIPDNRAIVIHPPSSEPIAVFRHNDRLAAITNVCAHQGGPLGEGKIIDVCITCPWHGWTYQPHDGCSPPPFTEKISTYNVLVVGETVFVDPRALAPGTKATSAWTGVRQNDHQAAG